MDQETLDWILPILITSVIVLTILWIILPFAVFGIKGRQDRTLEKMDTLISEAKKATLELRAARETLQRQAGEEVDPPHEPIKPLSEKTLWE